jgi:hypothetical protein
MSQTNIFNGMRTACTFSLMYGMIFSVTMLILQCVKRELYEIYQRYVAKTIAYKLIAKNSLLSFNWTPMAIL